MERMFTKAGDRKKEGGTVKIVNRYERGRRGPKRKDER